MDDAVFISRVSSEFKTIADRLVKHLRTRGLHVEDQETLCWRNGVAPGTPYTLEILHNYIRGCSTVLCFAGERSGAIPPKEATKKF